MSVINKRHWIENVENNTKRVDKFMSYSDYCMITKAITNWLYKNLNTRTDEVLKAYEIDAVSKDFSFKNGWLTDGKATILDNNVAKAIQSHVEAAAQIAEYKGLCGRDFPYYAVRLNTQERYYTPINEEYNCDHYTVFRVVSYRSYSVFNLMEAYYPGKEEDSRRIAVKIGLNSKDIAIKAATMLELYINLTQLVDNGNQDLYDNLVMFNTIDPMRYCRAIELEENVASGGAIDTFKPLSKKEAKNLYEEERANGFETRMIIPIMEAIETSGIDWQKFIEENINLNEFDEDGELELLDMYNIAFCKGA